MSKRRTPTQKTTEPGFWRLEHDHLAALLARRDLSWETARVYLAVADLTRGWGKERDVVSLSQIADQAGMFTEGQDGTRERDYRHVNRALRALQERELYGQAPGAGQAVIRWVVWPPPPLSDPRTTARAGSGATARVGSGATAKTTAKAGRHQDVQDVQEERKKKRAAAKPPPDSRVKTFMDWFCATYKTATGNRYIVSGGKDGATVKRLLRQLDGDGRDPVAELQAATGAMLADPWGRERASIGLLAGQINTWRSKARPEQSRENRYASGF